ncbi:hypothetical protein HBI55_160370 [Parastagonospora nodorum]|nr:hypothetical protein HBI55_160370 [Parastagonospora nodorum]
MMLAKVRQYSAKVKIEDLSNTLTLILSKIAQRRSLSVVSNRSTALITNKFSVALLTKPAILNNANVALVDAVHYSQKLEKNYFKVIDALTITLIKNDDDLLGTVNSYIKLRKLRARCKTEAADSRHAKVSRGRTKKDKDLEDFNTSSDVLRLRRRDRAAARARLAKRKQLEKEAQLKKTRDKEELAKAKKEKEEKENERQSLCKSRDGNRILHSRRTEVQNARAEGDAIEHNAVNDNNKLYPTKGERTFYCANSPLENMSRLTKEKAIKMQINTTNAIFKALAAANKLIILEANTPAVHSKATKHYLALLAAQFMIVCSFRKIDKHIFRAYNTISVTAQRTIIRKGSSYIEKRAILLPSYFNATDKRDSVTSNRIYKIEDAVYQSIAETLSYRTHFLSTVQNAKQQCRDILEKEGLNKLEASRRVIFNCFKICKVKRFTLNSVKDLFTNLSKDYFLVREARAITKSSPKFQNLSNLCSKVKILGTLS